MIKTQKPKPVKKLTKGETTISYEKTVSEIHQHLVRAGAKKITFDYDEAELPYNITFAYNTTKGIMCFSLPIRFNGMERLLKERGARFRTGELQPVNTAWRIMKDWILAQLALVDAEIAELPEIFLPYAITPDGDTLYDHLMNNDNSQLLLE